MKFSISRTKKNRRFRARRTMELKKPFLPGKKFFFLFLVVVKELEPFQFSIIKEKKPTTMGSLCSNPELTSSTS